MSEWYLTEIQQSGWQKINHYHPGEIIADEFRKTCFLIICVIITENIPQDKYLCNVVAIGVSPSTREHVKDFVL